MDVSVNRTIGTIQSPRSVAGLGGPEKVNLLDKSPRVRANHSMSFGFDPFAFGLAVIVSVIAIIEFRHNNLVILRIKHAAGDERQSVGENGARLFSEFQVLIVNVGIPLHQVAVAISFRPPGGSGRIFIPLNRYRPDSSEPVDERGEFARGMVGDFRLKSYQMRPEERQLFSRLTRPAEHNATIVIFAQGYTSKEFRVGTGRDLIAQRWNKLGTRINPFFSTWIRAKGSRNPSFKRGGLIRSVPSLVWALTNFSRNVGSG
jgi:hypothetical protein